MQPCNWETMDFMATTQGLFIRWLLSITRARIKQRVPAESEGGKHGLQFLGAHVQILNYEFLDLICLLKPGCQIRVGFTRIWIWLARKNRIWIRSSREKALDPTIFWHPNQDIRPNSKTATDPTKTPGSGSNTLIKTLHVLVAPGVSFLYCTNCR